MSGNIFLDTNILVYAHDLDAGWKQERAELILRDLWKRKSAALSMQVLQEFYNTVTRKPSLQIPKEKARALVNHYATWCIETTPQEIRQAFLIEDATHISFWDAMIVAAAIKSGATRILSEDLNHGQTIAGVQIENPFLMQ